MTSITERSTAAYEVVVEALRLLQEREDLFASHRDELRARRSRRASRRKSEASSETAVRRSPTYVAGSMSACAPESDPSISAGRSA